MTRPIIGWDVGGANIKAARIEDGVVDEFSVWVNGMPMLQRSDGELPSVEEVEAAIQNSEGQTSNVSSAGTVRQASRI